MRLFPRLSLSSALLLGPAALSAQAVYELPVARVEFCAQRADPYECRAWRPYQRVGDDTGPIWFLISLSGMACEVDGMVAGKIADERLGRPWLCAWRSPRA